MGYTAKYTVPPRIDCLTYDRRLATSPRSVELQAAASAGIVKGYGSAKGSGLVGDVPSTSLTTMKRSVERIANWFLGGGMDESVHFITLG